MYIHREMRKVYPGLMGPASGHDETAVIPAGSTDLLTGIYDTFLAAMDEALVSRKIWWHWWKQVKNDETVLQKFFTATNRKDHDPCIPEIFSNDETQLGEDDSDVQGEELEAAEVRKPTVTFWQTSDCPSVLCSGVLQHPGLRVPADVGSWARARCATHRLGEQSRGWVRCEGAAWAAAAGTGAGHPSQKEHETRETRKEAQAVN